MANRKIAECLNLRINVGNYQHIELTKYAEEVVEYSSQAELIQKEDALRDDLVASLIRSMKAIPEKLGKGVEAAQEVEEAIQKAIPAWLENGPIPNLANKAAQENLRNAAEQKANMDAAASNLAEVTSAVPATSAVENPTVTATPTSVDDTELFEDDEMPEPEQGKSVSAVKETGKVVEEVKAKKAAKEQVAVSKGDSLFGEEDEDLFA